MKCPICAEGMREVEKNGVTVDICPSCKGVWLDRGELEKLMEYAAASAVSGQSDFTGYSKNQREHSDSYGRYEHDDHDHDDHRKLKGHDSHGYGHEGRQGQYRKKSWVANIFDMFGD